MKLVKVIVFARLCIFVWEFGRDCGVEPEVEK